MFTGDTAAVRQRAIAAMLPLVWKRPTSWAAVYLFFGWGEFMKKVAIICALAGAAGFAMPASAQDRTADPISGTLSLSAGFTPDPRTVNVTAGGGIDASRRGGACAGMISESPDVRVVYDSNGSLPLVFSVAAQADTTLVINAPDGNFYCNDDTNGLNPRLIFRNAAGGAYEVWVGKIGDGDGTARLSVSEILPD